MIPIYVLTNDNHLPLTKGFAYLFNKYWGEFQEVTIVGYNEPKFHLPYNFRFYSINSTNYPCDKWSNGLIEFLQDCDEKYFILMLEDYFLTSFVDEAAINVLFHWFEAQNNYKALRLDLSNDRSSHPSAIGLGVTVANMYEVIHTPPVSTYRMSFQAAIWNRDILLEFLRKNESPWDAEMNGTDRLNKREDIFVLGVKDKVLPYIPVYRSKKNYGSLEAFSVLDQKELREVIDWGVFK